MPFFLFLAANAFVWALDCQSWDLLARGELFRRDASGMLWSNLDRLDLHGATLAQSADEIRLLRHAQNGSHIVLRGDVRILESHQDKVLDLAREKKIKFSWLPSDQGNIQPLIDGTRGRTIHRVCDR